MSGSNSDILIKINAPIEKATGQIDALNKRIEALKAPSERLQKSFSKLAENTGLSSLGRGMRDVAKSSLEAFHNIGRIAAPLGAITGAASIAGIARLTTEWANFGSKIGFQAQRIGASSDRLMTLQGAARLAGSSAESLTSGITSLNDNLTNAANGSAPQAVAALGYLKIALRDGSGQLRKATDVLPELADKLAAIHNPAIQAQLATMLLGGSAEDLLPFLRQGSKGIADYVEKARSYGVFNHAASVAANELRMKQVELSLAVEGLSLSIGEKLAPVLGPMLLDLATWIKNNRELIADDIASWVKDGVPAIKDFAKEVNSVVQGLGGWKRVLEGIIAIKLTGWAAGVIASLIPVLRVLLLIPGSGVTAATLGAVGLGYLGFKGAEKSGNDTAKAGEAGLQVVQTDDFGNGTLYRDQAGKLYTADEAREFARRQAGPAGVGGSIPQQPAGAPLSGDVEQRARNLMGRLEKDLGITHEAAAADVSNANAESGLKSIPTGLVPPTSRSAFGIWQFTGPRRVARDAFAAAHPGLSSEEADIQFHEQELREKFPALLKRMQTQGVSAQQHARDFFQTYESGGAASLQMYEGGHIANADRFAGMQSTAPAANIAGGTGAAQGGAATTTVRGGADLRIKLDGFPMPGTRTTATTDGDLFNGPPRISYAMPLGGP